MFESRSSGLAVGKPSTVIPLPSTPGAEVMVFGDEMILSLHRMKEGKLPPRQAASDRPQIDPCRHPHEFPNLFVTAVS